jgi:hypothetical protein
MKKQETKTNSYLLSSFNLLNMFRFRGENDQKPYVAVCQNEKCQRSGTKVTLLANITHAAPRAVLVSKLAADADGFVPCSLLC